LQKEQYQGLLWRRHLACDFHRNHNLLKNNNFTHAGSTLLQQHLFSNAVYLDFCKRLT